MKKRKKNLPSNAGSTPDQGTKIPHGLGQRSPGATTKEKPACYCEDPATTKTQCIIIIT